MNIYLTYEIIKLKIGMDREQGKIFYVKDFSGIADKNYHCIKNRYV